MQLLTRPSARQDDRIRRATASLRGAALAVATAAAALGEQMRNPDDCGTDDEDCISETYASLLAQRQRFDEVSDVIWRLERTELAYDGRVPVDAPRVGGQVPTVVVARDMVDRTHDRLVETLETARVALARFEASRAVH